MSQHQKSRVIAVDCETSSLDLFDSSYLLGVAFAERVDGAIVTQYEKYPIEEPMDEQLRMVKRWNERLEGALVVAHNLKFDYQALFNVGVYIRHGRDTLAVAHAIDENKFDYSLDTLAKEYLGEHKEKSVVDIYAGTGLSYAEIPYVILSGYAQQDAALCLKLYETLMEKFDGNEQQLDENFEFLALLAQMERRGVVVDQLFCHDQIAYGTKRMDEIKTELGFDPAKLNKLREHMFNKLKLPVLVTTKNGTPSLNKQAMEKYEEILENRGEPSASLILEYRGWHKATTSYYKKMIELADKNSIVHPDFRLTGTRTGRLSCRNPNMQQLPREGNKPWNEKSKSAFKPRPGYELWEYDYDQLEFRLCAAYAGEQKLLDEFSKDDSDVFTAMSKELKMPRQQAKTLTYSILYGAGVTRISNVFNINTNEAGKLRDNFYSTYPGIFRLSSHVSQLAESRGYIKLWNGEKRHLDKRISYKGMNTLIQGGAAALVRSAMLALRSLQSADLHMLLQVHDSIVFEVTEGMLEDFDSQIKTIMTDFPMFKVRLSVDGHKFSSA